MLIDNIIKKCLNKGSLEVFRGDWRVPNFFIACVCARNCIPAIKLLAISKTAKLEVFSYCRSKYGLLGGVPHCFKGSQYFFSMFVC